jgi:hypothetical protein
MLNVIPLTRCPECGQPVPHLTPQQQTVYDAIKRRPRSTGQLHDLLYLHRQGDGPSIKVIHVIVSQINRVLKKRGIRVKSVSGVYCLTGDQDAQI